MGELRKSGRRGGSAAAVGHHRLRRRGTHHKRHMPGAAAAASNWQARVQASSSCCECTAMLLLGGEQARPEQGTGARPWTLLCQRQQRLASYPRAQKGAASRQQLAAAKNLSSAPAR